MDEENKSQQESAAGDEPEVRVISVENDVDLNAKIRKLLETSKLCVLKN